jgi:hypothetical protein
VERPAVHRPQNPGLKSETWATQSLLVIDDYLDTLEVVRQETVKEMLSTLATYG